MTTLAHVYELRAQIKAAREEGDLALMSRLQAQYRALPLSLRNRAGGAEAQVDRLERASLPRVSMRLGAPGLTPVTLVMPTSQRSDALRMLDAPRERVLLRSNARARISAEARDCSDGRETAGFLYASLYGEPLEIIAATGPGPNARRSPTACEIDGEYIDSLDQERERYGSDLVHAGTWHTHPARSVTPSEKDLAGLAAGFVQLEARIGTRAAFVGIIATTCADAQLDWRWQELHAYVVRRDPISRRITCENAEVKEID